MHGDCAVVAACCGRTAFGGPTGDPYLHGYTSCTFSETPQTAFYIEMKRTRAVAESESAAVISTMEALEPLDGLEGFTMPTAETEAARSISPGFEIMQGQSEPFSEVETRALIRIRRRMHDQFESSNKKKGAKTLYVQLASELYEEGNGQVRFFMNYFVDCLSIGVAVGCLAKSHGLA